MSPFIGYDCECLLHYKSTFGPVSAFISFDMFLYSHMNKTVHMHS